MQTKEEIIDPKFESLEQDFRRAIEKCMDAWTQPAVDALKEAKELIEWMIKNMQLNCPDRNHHTFMEHLGNGYMNTMHLIDEALKQYNQ